MNGREFKDAAFSQFARVASAFGSPTRIELIDVLDQDERNVENLAAETGLGVANTSQHLQVLKGASLVSAKKAWL
jgi:DNA-binding transcriptional ArsR family regulator